MKFKIYLYTVVFYLIINIISNTSYDFTKYHSYKTFNDHAVFDCSGFNIGDMMYFKITAVFNDENLYYIYLDTLDNLASILTHNKDDFFETESYFDVGSSDDDDKTETRYYKIKKSEAELNNLSGKYLILLFFADGRVEIENTEKDEGKSSKIYTIIFSILGVLAVAGILFFCFCRDKLKCKKKDEPAIANTNANPQMNYNIPQTNNAQLYNKPGMYDNYQIDIDVNNQNYQTMGNVQTNNYLNNFGGNIHMNLNYKNNVDTNFGNKNPMNMNFRNNMPTSNFETSDRMNLNYKNNVDKNNFGNNNPMNMIFKNNVVTKNVVTKNMVTNNVVNNNKNVINNNGNVANNFGSSNRMNFNSNNNINIKINNNKVDIKFMDIKESTSPPAPVINNTNINRQYREYISLNQKSSENINEGNIP